MADRPRLIFPNGLTTTQAPLGAELLIDANLYDLEPPRCECCGRLLEAGHCYACKPVFGYGEAMPR